MFEPRNYGDSAAVSSKVVELGLNNYWIGCTDIMDEGK